MINKEHLVIFEKIKNMLKYRLYLIIIVVLVSSCSKVFFNATINQEPYIKLDNEIKYITLIDYTKIKLTPVNVINKVIKSNLSVKNPYYKKFILYGIKNALEKSGKYQVVITNLELKNNRRQINDIFPEPLHKEQIKTINNSDSSQLIISLEYFNTDINTLRNVKRRYYDKSMRKSFVRLTQKGFATVDFGVRIYSCVDYKIFDEHIINYTDKWEYTGIEEVNNHYYSTNEIKAMQNYYQNAGMFYSNRIITHQKLIKRFVYKISPIKNNEIKAANKYAEIKDWKKALELWKNQINKIPPYQKKYIAFNIAVAYELLGNHKEALIWAKKAYAEHNLNDAKKYINSLIQLYN